MKAMLIQIILPSVITVLSSLVSWALIEVKNYISAKTKSVLINTAMTHITNMADATVKTLNQTVVSDMKAKSPDGKLTNDAAKLIKDHAIETVKRLLTDEIKKNAGLGVTNIDSLIGSMIEQSIMNQKNQSSEKIKPTVLPDDFWGRTKLPEIFKNACVKDVTSDPSNQVEKEETVTDQPYAPESNA